ncbi:MAG TPA: arginine deiminase family protein [Candidatus Krumholzibacteria bacterium]|nr:arginine deiminase family protein [Candidatus Krumholzibacteria bacterium]HPD72205.1 arginine deiminase family protein [Candidatus Krumholzibacteria bacterium]HRY40863.1 arginine deiminase family protein [Candidatus Krumholzibacteria bacterium]
MSETFPVDVRSEVGRLTGVILHRPGPEVALMTPATAERALYSDILNRRVAAQEYAQLQGVLERWTRTFAVRDLLADILAERSVREVLVERVCARERVPELAPSLLGLEPAELTRALIEGVPLVRDTLTRFLSPDRFALPPLHNFFFMRDAAAALGDRVLIGRMASPVRAREALIMDAVFTHHPQLRTETIDPVRLGADRPEVTIEGGDVLVIRDDVLLVGVGRRTSTHAVDFLLERLAGDHAVRHVFVQELPPEPESFIHLDMAFTQLDRDLCMVYAPLILEHNHYETVQIRLAGGRVERIREVDSLLAGLREIGIDLAPAVCGGPADRWTQEREQWHSGTNFFALAPGKVIGYARNEHTLAELDRHGFAILAAGDVIAGRADPDAHARCVITIDGSELARGGGGCRCLTLPIGREAVS